MALSLRPGPHPEVRRLFSSFSHRCQEPCSRSRVPQRGGQAGSSVGVSAEDIVGGTRASLSSAVVSIHWGSGTNSEPCLAPVGLSLPAGAVSSCHAESSPAGQQVGPWAPAGQRRARAPPGGGPKLSPQKWHLGPAGVKGESTLTGSVPTPLRTVDTSRGTWVTGGCSEQNRPGALGLVG